MSTIKLTDSEIGRFTNKEQLQSYTKMLSVLPSFIRSSIFCLSFLHSCIISLIIQLFIDFLNYESKIRKKDYESWRRRKIRRL
jgi:hypothetical protein